MPLNIQRRPSAQLPFSHQLHPKIASIYAARGIIQPDDLNLSLANLIPVSQLTDSEKAAKILADGLALQKRITIIGDFDADGATSTAVCMLAFKSFGCQQLSYLVPNRFDFGYGLSPEIVNMAAQQGTDIIVTVDNGIACFAGVKRAKELGIQVIITDHHLPAQTLPEADAIVNPSRPDCSFASKAIAGVGVAFYTMLALRAELKLRGWFEQQGIPQPNLAELLDLVALGTVADVVPLDQNNRILVHQGLQRIRSGVCRSGITQLIKLAGREQSKIVASDLGFVVAPRLNAAGRLDDMSLGIECMLTDSVAKAREIATELDMLNRERRQIETGMRQEAEKTLDVLALNEEQLPKGICLFEADWHQGVIGIVAGRIKDKFHRPTIAFAQASDDGDCDELKGSARSVSGFHIRDFLESLDKHYPGLMIKFGGHAMAAGLSIKKAQYAAFKQAFESLAEKMIAEELLSKVLTTDGELGAEEFNLHFAALLKQAGPWGQKFEEPLFDGEFTLYQQRIVGESHLKLTLTTEYGEIIDAIAFNKAGPEWPNKHANKVQLAYRLDINKFRDKENLQLIVEELKAV